MGIVRHNIYACLLGTEKLKYIFILGTLCWFQNETNGTSQILKSANQVANPRGKKKKKKLVFKCVQYFVFTVNTK